MPPQRADISFGDAVTAICRLGAESPADRDAIVRLLDLRFGPMAAAEPEPDPPEGLTLETEPPTTGLDDPAVAGPAATSPAWDDLQVTSPPASEADRAAPDWGDGDRTDFTVAPGYSLVPSPPLPAEAARAAMSAVVATRRVGHQLDLEWMIARASRLEPIVPPRLLVEAHTAPVVWLLIDCGEGMEPYLADARFLAWELIAVAGTDRVERHTFAGTPARGLDPNPFSGDLKDWAWPPERALLVVLSDLGAGGALDVTDAASALEWAAFARSVEEAGATVRALTPFERDRRPNGLDKTAAWESFEEVVALRG